VLDHLGLERVAVIGRSYGGAIAVHLTRAVPERVEALVLLDPAMGLSPGDMLRAAEECRADETFPDVATAGADRAICWAGISDELVQAELAEHLVPDGDRWRYRYCPPAVVTAWGEMARPARTPPAGMPTLLIPAIRSAFVHPRWVWECRQELGDALIVAELDAGHMIFLEYTAEMADLIRPFLGR